MHQMALLLQREETADSNTTPKSQSLSELWAFKTVQIGVSLIVLSINCFINTGGREGEKTNI